MSLHTWTYDDRCEAVEREAALFAEVVADADPALDVPTCPGWTIADLIEHHGRSQRRVELVVRTLAQQPVWSKDVPSGLPGDPAAYAAWFTAGVPALVATLRAADPDAPLWTNGVDQHVPYWARRILFEAVVHRADAEVALGRKPAIDIRTAADGVDELLTNLPCFAWVAERQRDLGRDGDTLLLEATDSVAQWTITLTPDGYSWTPSVPAEPATATARATTGDLLLLAYGRLKPADARIDVAGDDELLALWLDRSAL
jgi:uncharacterized protein (TIGR03083 family)